MTYRVSAKGSAPTLSVYNHSRRRLIPFIAFALALVAVGLWMPVRWWRMGELTWGSLVFPAFFIFFGGCTALLLTKMARGRTSLTLDGERVIIELASGKVLELLRANLNGVDVVEDGDADGTTYGIRLLVANENPIPLDTSMGGDRRHYESTARAIREFLSEAGGGGA